jgi:hypothetical protein
MSDLIITKSNEVYLKVQAEPHVDYELRDHFKFEVDDLSESGIRFINWEQVKLYKNIQGVLTFLYGESIEVKGSIVWQENSLVGFLLEDLIPSAKFIKEQQYLILKNK